MKLLSIKQIKTNWRAVFLGFGSDDMVLCHVWEWWHVVNGRLSSWQDGPVSYVLLVQK